MNPDYQKLANLLVNFSVEVHPGDRVMIDVSAVPVEMTLALMRAVKDAGGFSFLKTPVARLQRELLLNGRAEDFQILSEQELALMKHMQCYIAIRGSENIYESSDVPAEQQNLYARIMRPAFDQRVNGTRWVVLRWPNAAMAQAAKQSTERFEEFYFRVCTMDYARMEKGMAALKARMEATDRVHIKSPNTDLHFSIKGMPAIPCGGKFNIPDGECYTAPIKDSVEGTITYNAPSIYHGQNFENVKLTFSRGKIVQATANHSAALNAILDSDEGARYIGEFALGFNPHILQPMEDILFDEKIAGSLHFTPGQAYENADNGNRSSVHWDLVLIQRPEYGGGEIYFDDELIRKDGIFLPKELQALNPDALLQ